ncbi:MAG: T9SS type A sorting domain-containing protein [Flavobacteriales bacterium]
MMKTTTLLGLALITFATLPAHSQTLTNTTNNPTVGETWTQNSYTYLSEGAAGASQTWNFSAAGTNSTFSQQFVTPASTPYVSNFPNANIATMNGGDYSYMKVDATGWEIHGVHGGSQGITIVYQDPEKILALPCSYNTTWTDNLAATFTSGGIPATRAGSISGVADGYGTLIMPYGTVSNVLRVKTIEDYSDDLDGNYEIDYLFTNYYYYKPGVHFALASVYDQDITIFGNTSTTLSMVWAPGTAIGMDELLRNSIGIDLYPNPTSAQTKVVFSGTAGEMQLELLDGTGRVVLAENLMGTSLGIMQHDLDVSGMPSGIYMLRITAEDGQQGVKRLVVQ